MKWFPFGGCKGRAGSGFSLFVVLALSLFAPAGALGAMVNSVHDFVDDGFTGGGVCAECHVPHGALDSRLWPRDATDPYVAPALLCMDCHTHGNVPIKDIQPSLGAAWSAVAKVVRRVPHDLDYQNPPSSGNYTFRNCTAVCHRHR